MVFTMCSLRVFAAPGGLHTGRSAEISAEECLSYLGGSGSGIPRCGGGLTARRVGCDRGGVPATRVRSARDDTVGRDDPVGADDARGRDEDDGIVSGGVSSTCGGFDGAEASGIVVVTVGV